MENIHIKTRKEIDKIWDKINEYSNPLFKLLMKLDSKYGIKKLTLEVNGKHKLYQSINDGAVIIDEYNK